MLLTRVERNEFVEAVHRAADKNGDKTMSGTEARDWMAAQGG